MGLQVRLEQVAHVREPQTHACLLVLRASRKRKTACSLDSANDRDPGERPAPVAGAARRFAGGHPACGNRVGPPYRCVHRHDLARRVRHSAPPHRTRRAISSRRETAKSVVAAEAQLRCDRPPTTGASRRSRWFLATSGGRGARRAAGGQQPPQPTDRGAPRRARSGHTAALPARRHRRNEPHRRLRVDAPPRPRCPRRAPSGPDRLRRAQGPRSICSGLRPGGSAHTRVRGRAVTDLHGLAPGGAARRRRRSAGVARVPRAPGRVDAPPPPGRRDPGPRPARDRHPGFFRVQLLGARRHRDGAPRIHRCRRGRVDPRACSRSTRRVEAQATRCRPSPSASGRPSTWCS